MPSQEEMMNEEVQTEAQEVNNPDNLFREVDGKFTQKDEESYKETTRQFQRHDRWGTPKGLGVAALIIIGVLGGILAILWATQSAIEAITPSLFQVFSGGR
jgi:hypothetical protein